MRGKKLIYPVLILTILLGLVFALLKSTYSANDVTYTFTRSKLQDMVMSTALSYYYNNTYSDYEQNTMDYKIVTDGQTGSDKLAGGDNYGTFRWHTLNNTPELVSRSNLYNVDCSTFTSIVYLYSLGYDYSTYYNLSRKSYKIADITSTDEYKISNRTISNNEAYWQESYLLTGKNYKLRELSSDPRINGQTYNPNHFNKNSSSEFVYYYKFTKDDQNDNTSKNAIKNAVRDALQPGDILGYKKDGGGGHVMIYVGDLFGNGERGLIHAVGNDTYEVNGLDLVYQSNSEDKYSIRYEIWDNYVLKNLPTTTNSEVYITRPINNYCTTTNNTETCKLKASEVRSYMHRPKTENGTTNYDDFNMLISQTKARNEFANLGVEQYQFKGGTITDVIDKYNSVNVGDTITYRLVLTNKNKFYYCTSGKYDNQSDCISDLDKNNNPRYEWKQTNRQTKAYEVIVSAKIPDNVEFDDEFLCRYQVHKTGGANITGNNGNNSNEKCSYNPSTRTLTWVSDTIAVNETAAHSFTYKVIAQEEGIVTNPGMIITTANNTLQMGELSANVNSTISGNKIGDFQAIIKNRAETNEVQYGQDPGIKFVRDIYTKYFDGEYLYNNVDGTWTKASSGAIGELSGYTSIKDAIFVDTQAKDNEYEAKYFKRVDYSGTETSDLKAKILNNMLVPGEYGGIWLRGNVTGDRASILFKDNGNKQTLEVGDVIFSYSGCGDTYGKSCSNNPKIYVFYGYDSNKLPIFYRAKNSNNTTIYEILDGNSNPTGYQLYKDIYSSELFMVFRPTRLSSVKYNIGYKLNGATTTENNTLPNNGNMMNAIAIPNPTKNVTWTFTDSDNLGVSISENQITFAQTFTGWTSSSDDNLSYGARSGASASGTNEWDGSLTKNTHFKDLALENETVTLTANWENTGTVTMPTVTKEGYTCYWKHDSTTAQSGEVRTPSLKASANYTWKAQCTTLNTYIFQFDANGGEGTMNVIEVTDGNSTTLPNNTFTRAGYTFKNWNSLANGKGDTYEDGYSGMGLTNTHGITLYAQWEPNIYSVVLNNQDAETSGTTKVWYKYYTNKMSDGTTTCYYYTNSSVTDCLSQYTITTPTKTGYTFEGYRVNNNGTGTRYIYGDGVFHSQLWKKLPSEINENYTNEVTLYANWVPNQYTIILDGNGGYIFEEEDISTEDEEEIQEIVPQETVELEATYGTSITLTSPSAFIKEGYTQTGWNTNANGNGTSYDLGQSVTNLVTSGSITLYAEWEINNYTVALNVINGTGSTSKSVIYNNTTTFNVSPNTGYTNATVTCTNGQAAVFSNNVVTTGNITDNTECTVTYSAGTYTVTANASGGEFTTTTGWTVNDDIVTKEVSYAGAYGVLPEVSKTGYTFNGWYTASTGGTVVTSETTVSSTTNHTIYARWTPNGYTIEFNANGGSGTVSELSATYDTPIALIPQSEFTRNGYTLTGWNTNESGTGTSYELGESVTNIAESGTVRLYAMWEINSYDVILNVINGTGSTSKEVEYNSTTTFDVLPNTGYVNGVVSCTNSQTATISNNVVTTGNITNDTECTVTYEAGTYTITANANEGTFTDTTGWTLDDDILTKEVTYDAAYGVLPEVTRPGYTFNGWYTSIMGGTRVTPETIVSVGNNHTLYAIWESIDLEFTTTPDIKTDNENSIISGINPGNTKTEIFNKITPAEGAVIALKDKDGALITDRDYLVTGDIISISNGVDERNYFIAVKGDVNSTGIMDKVDAKILTSYLINSHSEYDRNHIYAGDLNEDDHIKMNDIMRLLKELNKPNS